MTRLLRGVRRRLRLAWATSVGQLLAPLVAGAGVMVLLVARVISLPASAEAVAVLVGATLIALAVTALVLPIPERVCARAADRGLGTQDAFSTALELRGSSGPFAGRVEARAESLASGRRPAEAVPLRAQPRRLATTGVLGVAVVALLIVPNSKDAARGRTAAERALAAAEGRQLQAEAKALANAKGASSHQRAVAAQLQALANQLQHTSSVQRATEAVNALASTLAGQLSPNGLSEKAAALGLDQSLATRPLTSSSSGSAAQQLSQAAGQLSQMSAAAQSALAGRLQSLAATQTDGDPAAASQLSAAAGAIADGNDAAGSAALSAAANAQSAASADASNQAATANALADLADASSQLNAASQSSSGQNQAQGQTQGQGQGRGGGGGGGGGGTNAARASGGQGGSARPNGSGHNASVGLQTATVYSPVTSGQGPTLNAAGPVNRGASNSGTGTGNGRNVATAPVTPLADVLSQYQAQATQALNTLDLPPSERALVEAYFQGLANP